jgi:hypothetical protein
MRIPGEQKMSCSDEALSFFREWMNTRRNVFVTAVLEGVVVNGSGAVTSLEEWGMFLSDGAKFSINIPLEGCSFNSYDPERGSGNPAFDEVVRELGYSFGWEVVLPSNDRILLSELDMDTRPDG